MNPRLFCAWGRVSPRREARLGTVRADARFPAMTPILEALFVIISAGLLGGTLYGFLQALWSDEDR